MITRRKAVCLLASASAGACLAATQIGLNGSIAPNASAAKSHSAPRLAPGAPTSPGRLALIDAFRQQSEGLQKKFEARTFKDDWEMPYLLFRPATTRKAPLVMYLHGSGGLGNDNLKQLAFGNIFGTRLWLLPGNQKRFRVTSSHCRPTGDGFDTISHNGRPRNSLDSETEIGWR
jgi:hypothetical protein